jgi:hypothetical protein
MTPRFPASQRFQLLQLMYPLHFAQSSGLKAMTWFSVSALTIKKYDE